MTQDLQERLVALMTPALGEVLPDGQLELMRALAETLTTGGEIRPEALRGALPWQARDFWLPGAIAVGANLAQEYRVRQPSRLVYLDARAKTPPAGGAATLHLMASGAEAGRVTISSGQRQGFNPANARIAAGALLTVDAAETRGVANLTVTAWLVPDYR